MTRSVLPLLALTLALLACSEPKTPEPRAFDPDERLRAATAALERGPAPAAVDQVAGAFDAVRETGAQPSDAVLLARLQALLLPLPPDQADPRLLVNTTLALANAADLLAARQPLVEWTTAKRGELYSPYLALGHLAHAFGHDDPARMWFGRAAREAPARVEAPLAIAKLHAAAGDLSAARAGFDDLLERDPNLAEARLYRGIVYGQLGDEEKAMADWTAAAAGDAGDVGAQAANMVGAVLVKRGDHDAALAQFELAVERDPRAGAYAYNAGQLLHLMQRPEEARLQLERSIELRPTDHRPHFLLGQMGESEGQDEQAAGHFRAGLALSPTDETLRYALTRVLERLGRTEEAARVAAGEGP